MKKQMQNKQLESIKKTSYNPLKMRGAWIGGIVYPIFAFLYTNGIIPCFDMCPPFSFLQFVRDFILGFILGWGVHSLIRKLRSTR